MSFYGEQPKLNELNFKFDAYYPNRKALANALSTLNADATLPPLVGSYVLVSYYINSASTNTTDLSIQPGLGPGRYTTTGTSGSTINGTLTYNVTESTIYQYNLNQDLTQYKNSYHNTVWQRVGANNNSTFIMIAELNSLAPQLNIEYIHSARIATSSDTGKTRYTYSIDTTYPNYQYQNNLTPIQNLVRFLDQTANRTHPYTILENVTASNPTSAPKETILSYNSPEVHLEKSSELGYNMEIPTTPYFIFNLQKNNTALDAYDSINVAYDKKADAYVLNMFLGHFDAYLKKAMDGFEINENNFNSIWNTSSTWRTTWVVNS